MHENFSSLNLFWSERFKLFLIYRFHASAEILGKDETALVQAKLVEIPYSFTDTTVQFVPEKNRKAKVTERYKRYLRWKRNKLISDIFGSVLLPVIVSVLTTLATGTVLQWLESQGCTLLP